MIRVDRDAQRHGHGAHRLPQMRDRESPHPLTQLLRPLAGVFQRALGQDQQELLAAVATGHVAGADSRREDPAQLPQERVAGLVAEGVVETLEVIQVEHDDRQRTPAPLRLPDLPRQGLLHEAAVEQPSERIADRLVAQGVSQAQVRQSQRHLLRRAMG